MFRLFTNNRDTNRYPINKYSKFDYLERRLYNNLLIVKDYYRNKERAIENTNMISRLINSLVPSVDLPILEYLKIVETNGKFLARQFGITSNIGRGKVFNSIFYGENSTELFLYTENDFDIFSLKNKWEELTPIKVIHTNNVDLDFYVPFNDRININELLVVMEIDITILLLQYRYWVKDRVNKGMSTNVNVFLARVVTPNMLDNMLDLTIYNRFVRANDNTLFDTSFLDHPFDVTDYTHRLDKVLVNVYKDMVDSPLHFIQAYKTIPTVVNVDMLAALTISHKYYTKQSSWLLWVSRMTYYTDMISILGKPGIKNNTDILNGVKPYIKIMETYGKFDKMLSSSLFDDYVVKLNMLKKI